MHLHDTKSSFRSIFVINLSISMTNKYSRVLIRPVGLVHYYLTNKCLVENYCSAMTAVTGVM